MPTVDLPQQQVPLLVACLLDLLLQVAHDGLDGVVGLLDGTIALRMPRRAVHVLDVRVPLDEGLHQLVVELSAVVGLKHTHEGQSVTKRLLDSRNDRARCRSG